MIRPMNAMANGVNDTSCFSSIYKLYADEAVEAIKSVK
jgi:hypothetical protein